MSDLKNKARKAGGRFVQNRVQHPDKMDQLMQEAREADLLHGELGRTLRGSYEGHKQSVWMQRCATAMIVACIVALVTAPFRLPTPLFWILVGSPALAGIVFFFLGWGHLFRWIGIAYGPAPHEQENLNAGSKPTRQADSTSSDNTDQDP